MLRIVCHIVLCVLLSLPAAATGWPDSLFLQRSENNPDPIIKTDSPACIIPFSRAGNLILVQAKVDTTEGNFVLDTGAPHVVLNITYFRDYPATQSDAVQRSITGTGAPVLQTTLGKLTLGTINYHKAEADMVNLGHIENSRGVRILGLLGMSLFKQFEMIIDYERMVIHLRHITKKQAKTYRHEMLNNTTTYSEIPIDIMENRIVAQVELAGKKYKFVIDCAAESNILHSRLPDRVFENVVVTRRVMLSGSGTKKVEALYGDLSNLKIGGNELRTLPVLITNLDNTCFSMGGCIDGVLGFDFLSLQKVGFNFVTRKMYIWK